MASMSFHSWIMASGWRRSAAIAVCLWIAVVVGLAAWSAFDNDVELYDRTMLGLLLLGGPVVFASVIYAAVLSGKRALKWLIALCIAVAAALSVLAYIQHKRYEDLALNRSTEVPTTAVVDDQWHPIWNAIEDERRQGLRDSGYSEEIIDRVVPKPTTSARAAPNPYLENALSLPDEKRYAPDEFDVEKHVDQGQLPGTE
ncbi:TPA: hypothetical protein ACOECJ_004238 [Stenotrophomonas maltophilia]